MRVPAAKSSGDWVQPCSMTIKGSVLAAIGAWHVELVGAASGMVAEGHGQELRIVRRGGRPERGSATRQNAARQSRSTPANRFDQAGPHCGRRRPPALRRADRCRLVLEHALQCHGCFGESAGFGQACRREQVARQGRLHGPGLSGLGAARASPLGLESAGLPGRGGFNAFGRQVLPLPRGWPAARRARSPRQSTPGPIRPSRPARCWPVRAP